MKVIVALVALLAIASATDATYEALAQIHSHPLGHALLMSIKTNVDAGKSVDEVSQFLHTMLSNANTYSDRLDHNHKMRVGTLENNIKAQKELITNYQTIISKLRSAIATNKAEFETKTKILAQIRKELSENRDQLAKTHAEHARVAPQLKKDVDAAEEAEGAAREAIAHMEAYQAAISSSLLEVAASSESMIKAFSKHLEALKPQLIEKNAEASVLIHELIALTATPQQSKADKVLTLLKELLAVIAQEVSDAKAERAREQKTYEETVDALTKTIEDLETRERTLVARLKALQEKIKNDEDELKNQLVNLEDAEALLKSYQEDLKKENQAYAFNRKKTDGELKIMKELVNHFDSSVKSVNSYTKTAIHTGKGTF